METCYHMWVHRSVTRNRLRKPSCLAPLCSWGLISHRKYTNSSTSDDLNEQTVFYDHTLTRVSCGGALPADRKSCWKSIWLL